MSLPFMRWLGGKWAVSDRICDQVPEQYGTYYEPMLGGGSVMLRLLLRGRLNPGARMSDSNIYLIRAWKGLIEEPELVKKAVLEHAGQHDKRYFLRQRELQPEMLDADLITASAWFLYLNRASFNGLWRVSLSGKANLSWGEKSVFSIRNFATMETAVQHMHKAGITSDQFVCQDVLQSMKQVGDGDVAYVDPPYVATFDKYARGEWGPDKHTELAVACRDAAARGATVLLSQSAEGKAIYDEPVGQDAVAMTLTVHRHVSRDPSTRGVVKDCLYLIGGSNA